MNSCVVTRFVTNLEEVPFKTWRDALAEPWTAATLSRVLRALTCHKAGDIFKTSLVYRGEGGGLCSSHELTGREIYLGFWR